MNDNMWGKNMEELTVIQGDTLSCLLTIEKPEELEISKVVFNCPSLGIERDLIPANECEDLWGLTMSASETENLWIGRWDFNITVTGANQQVYTVIHNGNFIVERKRKTGSTPIPPGVITGIGWTED